MKVKTYFGNYIPPFGKPLVIVTGSETADRFFCERFVFFETANGVIKRAKCTGIRKDTFSLLHQLQNDDGALELFMSQEGKAFAEHDIYDIIIALNQKGIDGAHLFSVRTDLFESQLLVSLFYLKRKMRAEFDWLFQNTRVEPLKAILQTIASTVVTEHNYDE